MANSCDRCICLKCKRFRPYNFNPCCWDEEIKCQNEDGTVEQKCDRYIEKEEK